MLRRWRHRKSLRPADVRLLHDLVVMTVVLHRKRPPARERLEQALGVDFARELCASLAGAPQHKAA